MGNRAGFLPGLDWRGVGGYIVTAPSVGANGLSYEWAVSLLEQVLEHARPWLVGLLEQRPQTQTTSYIGDIARSTPYGRRALEAEAGRVALAAIGSRNDQLNRSAFAIGQLVAGGEVDLDDAYDVLEIAAMRSGLEGTELARTIESGLASGMRTPRTAPR